MVGRPWHFNKVLIVFKEPSGIRNMRKEEFTHAAFCIQIHNELIVCMEWDNINVQKLGELHGEILEVETNNDGECIGRYTRVRISVGIIIPLKKIIFLKLEDGDEVELPVLYEWLPSFCFRCGLIRHSLKNV